MFLLRYIMCEENEEKTYQSWMLTVHGAQEFNMNGRYL